MIEIRPLSRVDAAAYSALRLRMLREYPDAFTSSFEEDSLKPMSWAEARLSAPPNSPHNFVLGAFEDLMLVGSVGLAVEDRIKQRHKALLFGMFVAPEVAGRGIGRMLLAACIERARTIPDLDLVNLTVTTTNARSYGFYAAAGFRTFGIEEDAIRVAGVAHAKAHMVLELHPQRGGTVKR